MMPHVACHPGAPLPLGHLTQTRQLQALKGRRLGQREAQGLSYLWISHSSQRPALEHGFAHGVTKSLIFVTMHQVQIHVAWLTLLQSPGTQGLSQQRGKGHG